jgi:TolB protein
MNKCYLALFLILFSRCKQSPEKQASDPQASVQKPSASTIPARRIYDYCYNNRSGLFVGNAGDPARLHLKLSVNDVKLSPDGAFLAYTDLNSPDHERRIGLMDLTTLKTALLDSACRNCYGPVWSPDGKFLAYNAMEGQKWNIKYLNIARGKSAFITLHAGNLGNFSPQWSADSKKIIVQDMAGIYIIDLNSNILRTIDISSMDTTLLIGSSTQFLLTGKEDKLIFDSQVSTDSTDVNEEGEPPPHIFAYDLDAKKLTRLEPKDHICFSPVLNGDTIFCSGYKTKGKGSMNIYSMDLSGGHFKLAVRDGQNFSCRTQ